MANPEWGRPSSGLAGPRSSAPYLVVDVGRPDASSSPKIADSALPAPQSLEIRQGGLLRFPRP